MKHFPLFFWQPSFDLIRLFRQTSFGKYLLIFLNYSIWLFFFFVSYLLVKQDANTFWQLLVSTSLAELIERYIKSKVFWRRPMFTRGDTTPAGLVDKWYKTGSFPSGHTIKAMIFFLLILQHPVMSPVLFLAVSLPLLVFRVLAGFHYPIDMFGGLVLGFVIWASNFQLLMPVPLNLFIRKLFNFVFLVK